MIGDTTTDKPFGVHEELDESCQVINRTFEKLDELLHLPAEVHGPADLADLNSSQMIYRDAVTMLATWNDSRVKENAAVILRDPNRKRKISWAIALITRRATHSKDPRSRSA